MDQQRCYGCMRLISEPVCPHCGHPADGRNRPEQLRVGTLLRGRYLIGRVVERSSESLVYVALDQAQDKNVNIREYFPVSAAGREELQVRPSDATRFSAGLERRRKAASLALASQELARATGVYDAFEENGTVYEAVDTAKGPTLEQYAQRRDGVLDPQEVMRVLRSVIGAVAVLHQNGLTHGGISAAKVTLDPMGGARIGGAGDIPASPEDDVLALCTLICGGQTPDKFPGLPEQQRSVLEMGLRPDPRERFGSAVALRRALYGDVTLPMGPLPALAVVAPVAAPPAQPEPMAFEMPKTEAIAPEMPKTVAFSAPVEEPSVPSYEPPVPSYEPPAAPYQPPVQSWQEPPKKKKTGLIVGIIVGVVALLAALVICYFTVHIWQDATCEEPRTCALCGKTQGRARDHEWLAATCEAPETCDLCGETQGSALGHRWVEATCLSPKRCETCGAAEGSALPHDWMDATCESPKTCRACGTTEGSVGGHTWLDATCLDPQICSTCGKTQGSPLGHSWKDATYDAPKTCTRCGETDGHPKGYLEYVDGEFQRFNWGNSNTSAYVFDRPVYGCRSLNLYFKPTFNYNAWVDDWKLLYQDTSGKWHEYGAFSLNTSNYEHVFNFSTKLDIKAVAVVPRINGTYSYSFSLGVWDVYYTN